MKKISFRDCSAYKNDDAPRGPLWMHFQKHLIRFFKNKKKIDEKKNLLGTNLFTKKRKENNSYIRKNPNTKMARQKKAPEEEPKICGFAFLIPSHVTPFQPWKRETLESIK